MTRIKKFLVLVALGLIVTVTTGLVHGRLSQRWGPVPKLSVAAEHVASFPERIGDWELVAEMPMKEATIEMLECAGYVNRRYVNRATGEMITIAVIVGPSGPIAVHTPEICYSSIAYKLSEPRERSTVVDADGTAHSLWSLGFTPTGPNADRLRVNYAWSAGGPWEASESPRFEFAGEPGLFKLQIATLVPASTDRTDDPGREFVADLLMSGWSPYEF